MATPGDLDDPDQPTVYIPYQGSGNGRNREDLAYSPSPSIDLPDGYKLRLEIYKRAWAKCLARIQESIRGLHSPLAANIVRQVKYAYSEVLPGLPFKELPVISVLAQGGGNFILHEVATQIENLSDEDDGEDGSTCCAQLIHLYPSDCPNIMTAMKSMILRFIDASAEARTKRKATESLASYDIELLKAWYASSQIQTDKPRLVVMFHDFEQLEPAVGQDLFYICSLHISTLPLVFILSLSSPLEPSYLHIAYPRSTLALLRVRNVTVPSGIKVLEQIISDTFFDLKFDPDIVPGPTVLEFIYDHITRNNPSLDSVITILQLTYMKHVDEPLTTFLYDELLGMGDHLSASGRLEEASSYPFLNYLLTRTLTFQPDSATHWRTVDFVKLLEIIADCRRQFRSNYRKFKVGFCLIVSVREFMTKLGYKSVEGDSILEMMSRGLRGRLSRDWKYLGIMIKKLSIENLGSLIEQTNWFFEDFPEDLYEEEEEARFTVIRFGDEVLNLRESDEPALRDVASRAGDWFTRYVERRLIRLDESKLWDMWYTGLSPFPSELINPAPKARIIAALSHPEDYFVQDFRRDVGNGHINNQNPQQVDLSMLPDTSILFRRYLEAGRMINVYDWFESFAVVLESQRRKLTDKDNTDDDDDTTKTPTKRRGNEKELEHGGEIEAEDEENWRIQVQARFIRAVHELDFIGLVKHTGRKADHILKTVFDMPD